MRWEGPCKSTQSRAEARNCSSEFRWRNKMPIRVLLADDHAIVRQGLRALLEREGIQVAAEASNGHEVVRLVPSIRPDIAILDVSMPLLNGRSEERRVGKECRCR